MRKIRRSEYGFAVIEVVLLVLIIGLIGGTAWYVVGARHKISKNSSSTTETIAKATLRIDSEPAGIDIVGKPQCDSKKLNKQTPYICTQSSINTVLTAEQTVTVNNESYTFQTWDGCTDTNTDKKVCTVKISTTNTYAVKAMYVKALAANNQQTSSQPIVSCTGGTSSGDTCVATIDINKVPAYLDIRANQVSPFPFAIKNNGATPLVITCTPATACEDGISGQPVTSVRSGWIQWKIKATATIKVVADKNPSATDSQDGKTRTWKFKQFKLSQPADTKCTSENLYCNDMSVEYDFVSIR